VTEVVRRKNFLVVEGRLLADGRQGQLTPEEWLYEYDQVKDELVGAQVAVVAEFKERIRKQVVERAMDVVAL